MKHTFKLAALLLIFLGSCGPSKERAAQDKRDKEKTSHDSLLKVQVLKADEIKRLVKSVISHLQDGPVSSVGYFDGLIGPTDSTIWELLTYEYVDDFRSTTIPKQTCDCKPAQVGDMTYPNQYLVNYLCTRNKGGMIKHPDNPVNLLGEIDKIGPLKWIPCGPQNCIFVLKGGRVTLKQHRIGDIEEFKRLMALIEERKNDEDTKRLGPFYPVQYFNEDFMPEEPLYFVDPK
jgi:hypothetical protein